MPKFYLHYGQPDNSHHHRKITETPAPGERYFLDDRVHNTAEVVKTIEATSWLAAREEVPDFI